MKVFMIGGTGLLGSEAAKVLIERGHEVVSVALPPLPEGAVLPPEMKIEYEKPAVYLLRNMVAAGGKGIEADYGRGEPYCELFQRGRSGIYPLPEKHHGTVAGSAASPGIMSGHGFC